MVMIFVIVLLLFANSHAFFLPFNSTLFPPFPNLSPPSLPSPSPSNSFLNDVLKAIAAKERWDPNGEIRVLELDSGNARVGRSQRYEFHVRVGRTVLMLKFADDVASWRKPGGEWPEFGPDLIADWLAGARRPAIGELELEGPLDLRVDRGNDEISLLLPAHNITHKSLNRVLVGEGISIKVEGAHEVSLSHPHSIGLVLNGSLATQCADRNQFLLLGHPSCVPLLSVRVVGPASLIAYRTHNSEAYIDTTFHSHDTIELLPDKCYSNGHLEQFPSCSLGSLSSTLVLMKKVLRSFLGNSISQGGRSTCLLKAKITSLNVVKFRLELERDVTENDRIRKSVAAWRTKPVVERMWFEILARVEAGKGLKQMVVRKLSRPLMTVESSAWSNLMSNISFTQFSSFVVPPEALTLDVKW